MGVGLMAITVEGTPTVTEVGTGTSITAPVPAGTAAGEILVAQLAQEASTAPPAQSGWTSVAGTGLGSIGVGLYHRVASGSEPASYTFTGLTSGRNSATLLRLSGVDTSTPLDTAASTATVPSGSSITLPSLTTVTDGAYILTALAVQSTGADRVWTPPSGGTILAGTTGTSRRNVVAGETRPTAGATGTRTFALTATLPQAGAQAAFRPATGGAPPAGTLTSLRIGVPTGTSAPVTVDTTGVTTGVRLKVADNAGMTSAAFTTSAVPDSDGYATITVTGLTPGTSYWVQAEVDGAVNTGQTGTFTTDPGGQWSGRIAFGSCLTSGAAVSTAFDNIVANSPELFLHLGDWHYDNSTTTNAAAHAASIDAQVAANPGLKTLLRTVPFAYQWSDHDSGSNDWTGGPASWTPSYNTAYRQTTPMLESLPTGGIYHSVHRGRVKFILTDGRSYKSPAANTDNASKTMFGATQEAWIANELADPDYAVKIVCLDVPWVYPTTAGDDKWGGYTSAAARLVQAIADASANVFLIHGDAHSLCADDGTSSNNRGNLPVAGAAPFRNSTSIKGGPYSQSTWPTSGAIGSTESQHGLLDVTDTGDSITIRYSGRDSSNVERVTLTQVYNLGVAPQRVLIGGTWSDETPRVLVGGTWVDDVHRSAV